MPLFTFLISRLFIQMARALSSVSAFAMMRSLKPGARWKGRFSFLIVDVPASHRRRRPQSQAGIGRKGESEESRQIYLPRLVSRGSAILR